MHKRPLAALVPPCAPSNTKDKKLLTWRMAYLCTVGLKPGFCLQSKKPDPTDLTTVHRWI